MTDEGLDRTTRARRDGTSSEKLNRLWPTPRTITGGGESSMRKQELGRMESGGGDLQAEAQLWQTPATDSFRSRGGMRKDEMGLDQQARKQFPSPAGRDYRSPNLKSFKDRGGEMKGEQLPNFIEHSFLPDQPTENDGPQSSENAPTSPRRLNPAFVEWLQGLPEDWTSAGKINSEALEIWLSQSRELLRFLCF